MPIFLYDDAIKSSGFQRISDPHNFPMIPEADRKGELDMNTNHEFARFKKIDAHTHIGAFGSPFNIHFDTERLLQQMETYKIEKTILVASGPHANEDTAAAFRAEPQKIIPLMWINCAEGKAAYDTLEHYIRDEHFAGAKLQPLFDGYTAAPVRPLRPSALLPSLADRPLSRAPPEASHRNDPYGPCPRRLCGRSHHHGQEI